MNTTKKLVALSVACAVFGTTLLHAETISGVGKAELGIQENGGLVAARRVAREAAETDAVLSVLRLRMNVDGTTPAAKKSLNDLAKQLSANPDTLKTTFVTEGDVLTAKTVLSIDSAEIFELARSIKGLVSATATSSAKILFLIDEYYGVSTNITPGAPLTTEISYSHDKSKASASSKSASSASSSKEAIAVSGSAKSSLAASDSASVSSRDKASISGSQKTGVAVTDGYGNSGAASRDTRVAGSSDSSLDASRKSSVAASSQSNYAGAASSEQAQASSSASASASSQKDVVNYSFKQKFPDTNNAKPADDSAALISQRLEQIIKPYGLAYTPERDFRRDNKGVKLLISDIEKQRKFESLTQKASKQPYSAKYIVYGTSVMSAEGKTPSGDTTCSGLLKLTSFSVDSGDGLISGTLGKRAQGSSDQDCRTNLATALATELASMIGNTAAKELQLEATQGQKFYVMLYGSKKVKPAIRREFIKQLEGISDELRDDNQTDTSWSFEVQGKSGFLRKLGEIKDDLADANQDVMKNAKLLTKGNRIVLCVDGACPKEY